MTAYAADYARPDEGSPAVQLLRTSPPGEPLNRPLGDRANRATRWALQLDATLSKRLEADRSVEIRVPGGDPWAGRAYGDSLEDYRRLRLGVGELIRPWLLDHEELTPPPFASLYAFQRNGVEWLIKRPGGAILADDMGLGKTVQVIAAARILFNRAQIRRVLVLCPKSLLASWEQEFHRWSPELGVAAMSPPGRIKEPVWRALAWRRHVLVTNYEQMREPPAALRNQPPDLLVADEAHRLRKREAKATAGVLALRPRRFWAVTGTPIERDTNDLGTLLSLVERQRFSARDGQLHPSSLRAQARDFVLRRRKEEVLDDLPPRRDVMERIELTPEQGEAYRATVAQIRARGGDGSELALLTRLREICDLDRKTGASSKSDRIMDLLVRIRDQGEKAVVFSYLLKPLHDLHARIRETVGPGASRLLVGDMTTEERDRAVREFRQDPAVLCLLASTRVGGEGLTLVEANHAFLFNQWWNPSTNHQAIDRIVRIGQKNRVQIYRFCCRRTIEERLEAILREKGKLFDSTVEGLARDANWAMKRIHGIVGTAALLGTGPRP